MSALKAEVQGSYLKAYASRGFPLRKHNRSDATAGTPMMRDPAQLNRKQKRRDEDGCFMGSVSQET